MVIKKDNKINQLDLFVANIIDVAVKSDVGSMEYPLFSLSTRPDTAKTVHEVGGKRLQITPSVEGRPTIFDKDLLIYAISQVVEAENRGKKTSRRVQFNAHQFLTATGRGTAGKDYQAMAAALVRLRGLTFKIEDGTAKRSSTGVKGLIDDGSFVYDEQQNRMAAVEITLSEWIYDAIERMHVLTYHRGYFDLRKPNERRLYELCRKFCGQKKFWEISLDKLHEYFGTKAIKREWMRDMRKLVDAQRIPEYSVSLDENRGMFQCGWLDAIE